MFDKKILPFLVIILIDTIEAGIIIPVLGPALMSGHSLLIAANTSVDTRYYLYSLVLSAFFVFNFFASPLLGVLSDHYGRKRTIIISGLIKSVASLLTAISFVYGNLILLIFSRVVMGASSATIAIAQAAIASKSHTGNKAKNLGLASMAAALGFLFGPICAAILSKNVYHGFNFSTPFFFAAILPLFTIIVLWFDKEVRVQGTEAPSLRDVIKTIFYSLVEAKNRNVFIGFFLLCLAWAYFYLMLTPYLTLNYHYNSGDNAIILTYAVFLFIFSAAVLVPFLSGRFGLAKSIIIYSVFIVIGDTIIPAVDSIAMVWIAVGCIVLGFGGAVPTLLTAISNLRHETEQGKIMGISGSVQSLSIALASITVGFLGANLVFFPYDLIILLIALMIWILGIERNR